MRKFFYIILPLIAILSIGCSRPSNPDLLVAERLIDDEAEKALFILDSIPAESISREANQTLYGLLLTQAQEKARMLSLFLLKLSRTCVCAAGRPTMSKED